MATKALETDIDLLPSFRLQDLVSELDMPGSLERKDSQLDGVGLAMQALEEEAGAELSDVIDSCSQSNERAAADFLRCAREAGHKGLCDALGFCGLRNELPQLLSAGITVLAPTDAAFAQLAKETRCNAPLVRQLLLAHFCSGTSMLSDLQAKRCAVALAGQVRRALPPP